MIAWWSSPTPVDPDFIRRERMDAAAIPLRVWLAVLDEGCGSILIVSVLTLCGWIPGVLAAVAICANRKR